MRRLTSARVSLVALSLTAALTAGLLVGCNETDTDAATATDEPAATAVADETDEAGDTASTEGDDAAADAGADTAPQAEETAAAGTVDAGMFTFVIPQYWVDRVEVTIDAEGYGPRVTVSLPGNPDAQLAILSLEAGEEADVAGDIGYHRVGSVPDGRGDHVEVWTYNWPWIAASGAAGDVGIDEEALYELVDLSSGGLLTYEDACAQGADAIDMAESSYTSSTLVPTISFG